MRLFVACLALWLVFSARVDALHLGLGVAAALLVAGANRGEESVTPVVRALPRLARYVPWLVGQIVLSSLQVTRLVLDPRLPIDPEVVEVRPALRSDVALTALANSITLTPGTVTLDLRDGRLLVHALTRESARAVVAGAIATRVARAFPDGAA